MSCRRHLRLKLSGSLALLGWISVPYFSLQRVALFPAAVMQPTALDRSIPFQPHMMVVYLSLFVFLPLAPWLETRATNIWRCALGMFLIALVSHLCFLLWPTSVERPLPVCGGLYAWVVGVDLPRNACPSLHAALGVFAALCWESLLASSHSSVQPTHRAEASSNTHKIRLSSKYALAEWRVGAELASALWLAAPLSLQHPEGGGKLPYKPSARASSYLMGNEASSAPAPLPSRLCHQNLLRAAIWLWLLGILYATLATKQHVVPDLVAGALLGASTFACVQSWKGARAC